MLNTQGIILNSESFREADKRFSFYTLDFGKMLVLARGVRKIKSKLAGHLQPFCILDLAIAPGRRYNHLTGVTINKKLLSLDNLAKIRLAQHLLGVVDDLTKPVKSDKKIFDLISVFLAELNNWSELNSDQLKQIGQLMGDAFVFKLLSFLGYQPYLFKCVKCENKVGEKAIFFDVEQGGIICRSCGEDKEVKGMKREEKGSVLNTREEIGKEVLGVLQLLLLKKLSFFTDLGRPGRQKLRIISGGRDAHSVIKQVHQIVTNFLNWHLNEFQFSNKEKK